MAVSIEARQAPAKATGVSIEARQAPAKATGVSIPHEHERAKATTVSDNRAPGRQGQTAVPMGGGRAWPGDQWAADVTNVVKPTRFTSPREDPCYKRRQSEPKNRHFQRKSPRIDDVCNNTHPSTPKTQRTRRDSMATLKPTTPLRATNKGPLKPTSPLHPKTAPKTPISHPQRRWRFHSHTGISEQRRWRFQTTGPAGLQGLAATPARSYKPTPQKTRMQFDWERFQQRLKTLQFQRSEFKT